MSELCTDNRFELIEKYKQKLIDATNIEMAPDEMAVIDDILFRFWQMGWLDKLDADAVPVKPGKWSAYDVSGYRKCSMCGGYVNWNPKPFLFGEGEYNYCPNCGAKMEE